MLTTLGLILLGFAGFSAAFILFVFLFGSKGSLLNITKTGIGSNSTGWLFPISTFPSVAASSPQTASNGIGNGDVLDITLTTLGMVFIYGGMIATLLISILLFVAPWSLLNKCNVCNVACKAKEVCCPPPPPACGCGV